MQFFRCCDMGYPARPPKLPPGDRSIGDPWVQLYMYFQCQKTIKYLYSVTPQ